MSNSLTTEKINRFKEAQTFSDESKITSTDFSIDGKYFVTANENEQIVWIDCLRGKENRVINSHKYGVKLVKYTHGKTAVLHSSSKVNHDIRLVDVQKQHYYRYFKGHERTVNGLSISSKEDIFASSAEDRTVRLWDFRSEKAIGNLLLNIERPTVQFLPIENFFAIGFDNNAHISIFDMRTYQNNKPLKRITLDKDRNYHPYEMKFSKDGAKLLVSTNGSFIHLHDVPTGLPLAQLTGFKNDSRIPLEADFTPDSTHVVSGSSDGFIHFWDVTKENIKVAKLTSTHPEVIRHIKFNPTFQMFASSCKRTSFWVTNSSPRS